MRPWFWYVVTKFVKKLHAKIQTHVMFNLLVLVYGLGKITCVHAFQRITKFYEISTVFYVVFYIIVSQIRYSV